MVPDKFNMVDMEGIDILFSYGDIIPGLYQKLVESIAQCRYQCLYNWYFDGVLIPPTYVEMTVNQDTNDVWINGAVFVTNGDRMLVHLPSIETVSGSIVNITDGLPRKVEGLICYINPAQAGSGTPSPNNIRPISGFSEIKVYNEETYDVNAMPKLVINWQDDAGTIYGGTVTFNEYGSADLTTNYAIANLGNFSWSYDASQIFFESNRLTSTNRYGIGLMCDTYKALENTSRPPDDFAIWFNNATSNSYTYFRVRDSRYTDAAEFKAFVTGKYAAFVLKPEYQQTYHFDNIGQLYTRLGTNVIWHDANGDISVTYWKQ